VLEQEVHIVLGFRLAMGEVILGKVVYTLQKPSGSAYASDP